MSGKKIKMVDGIGQKSIQEAVEDFMRHCKLKNLSAATKVIAFRQSIRGFVG